MDFITGLPVLEGHNAILIVVNHLSKKRHYISYMAAKEGITLEETAQMLYQNV